MNLPIDLTNTTLLTDRLILRPWTWDNLDDFYAYASEDGVGQMAGWMRISGKEKAACNDTYRRMTDYFKNAILLTMAGSFA